MLVVFIVVVEYCVDYQQCEQVEWQVDIEDLVSGGVLYQKIVDQWVDYCCQVENVVEQFLIVVVVGGWDDVGDCCYVDYYQVVVVEFLQVVYQYQLGYILCQFVECGVDEKQFNCYLQYNFVVEQIVKFIVQWYCDGGVEDIGGDYSGKFVQFVQFVDNCWQCGGDNGLIQC